jgi:hypothetical protein
MMTDWFAAAGADEGCDVTGAGANDTGEATGAVENDGGGAATGGGVTTVFGAIGANDT